MPFTDVPDPIIASLTDIGRTNLARATIGDLSFKVVGFKTGRGGYNDANPVKTIVIDTTATALIDPIFPVSGIKPYEALEFPTPKTLVVNCRIASTESVAGLGEIGLYATVLESSVPAEVGTDFLLAIGHFPLFTKTLKQAVLYRFVIQF